MNTPNFHIIIVKYLGATDTTGSRVKMISQRFDRDSVSIGYDHKFNSTCDVAEDYLVKNGFNITGKGEGPDCYYLMTTTFLPINPKRRKEVEEKKKSFETAAKY